MAYDGWVEFGDTEIVNLSRTAQLAETLGLLDVVRVDAAEVAWIQDRLGGVDYEDVTTAPWYDPGYPASAEFAGVLSLGFSGLDDSTRESAPVEYVSDGGNAGHARSGTLAVVASAALVATTDRGAEYGRRWLTKALRGGAASPTCFGIELTYFRYNGDDAPKAHRRNVKTTRGLSITRKRRGACSSVWLCTFTLTAGDPFEYGHEAFVLADLGAESPIGPHIISSGHTALTQGVCAEYDYTPIYDPLYPALVPAPTAPDFYPEGWPVLPGSTFSRSWARIQVPEPSELDQVPIITLTSDVEVRGVRVSIWASTDLPDDQCDPLFTAIVTYLPGDDTGFIIDAEQRVSYVWDGVSASVRRADSLVYGENARPMDWAAINDPDSLLVTLDVFAGSDDTAEVLASLALVPKSD